jgi:hemerythrin superfamily protein
MNKSEIPQAQKAVLGALMDDHRKVKQMFKQFESEKDQRKQMGLVAGACIELTIHTKIEEELFYPFLRDQAPEVFGDLLNEALVEHASAKELVSQLKDSTPGEDDLYDAKFTVLGEYVNHHIKEEEGELFPKVISKKIDLRELKEQLERRKEELTKESANA